jgi:hypothetical protein
MPRAFVALPVVAVVFAFAPMTATAREFPFCIKGCDFGGGSGRGDCSFSSYAQCQASAAGRTAWCDANPYYGARAELQPTRSRLSHRRF